MKRPWIAKLSMLTVSLSLALGVGECVFRAHERREAASQKNDDDWRANISRMNRTIYRRSDDARLVYEPTPSSSAQMPYGAAGFNAVAARDEREIAVEPAAGTRRIVLMGDSVVWGEHVAQRDTVAPRLERALGAGVEVLDMGVTGYSTAQEALWYERAVRRLRPQAVVLVYCVNDAMIMSGPYNRYGTPEDERRKDEQDRYFARVASVRAETLDDVLRDRERGAWLHTFARARTLWARAAYQRSSEYADEYLLSHDDSQRFAVVRESLATLGAALRRDGVEAHFVVAPVLADWERYHWQSVHERVERAAEASGFRVLRLWPAWRDRYKSERSLRVYGDRLHLSEQGHEALAQSLAGVLRRNQ